MNYLALLPCLCCQIWYGIKILTGGMEEVDFMLSKDMEGFLDFEKGKTTSILTCYIIHTRHIILCTCTCIWNNHFYLCRICV